VGARPAHRPRHTEIEYSQPVLYKHFSSMEDIVEAVALKGFSELAAALRAARPGHGGAEEVLNRVAHAHCGFADENPVLYDAMFTGATRLRFAAEDTPVQLRAAFSELRRGSRHRGRRAGRRHPDRGALGGAARVDHARGQRSATPGRDAPSASGSWSSSSTTPAPRIGEKNGSSARRTSRQHRVTLRDHCTSLTFRDSRMPKG
jgi:AcrR family transcriptional regulator